MRVGDTIRVSGTTANLPPTLEKLTPSAALGGTCARCQTVAALDIIERSVKKLGGRMSDIVRTRVMVRGEELCEPVSLAHGWMFQSCLGIRPANTLVTAGLIGDDFLVEIEAEAVVNSHGKGVLILE